MTLLKQFKQQRKKLLEDWIKKRKELDELMRKDEIGCYQNEKPLVLGLTKKYIKELNEISEQIKTLERLFNFNYV